MHILNKKYSFKELFVTPRKMKDGGQTNKIQQKADEINAFGKLVKTGSISSIAREVLNIRNEGENFYGQPFEMSIKDADVILKKYGKYDEVHKKAIELDKEEEEFIDPAGGSGLRSHV